MTAISTVTATMSEMPAASRKATKMRGSAAGATILTMRCEERKPQRARDLDQPRLDARKPPRAYRISSGQKQANATMAISSR